MMYFIVQMHNFINYVVMYKTLFCSVYYILYHSKTSLTLSTYLSHLLCLWFIRVNLNIISIQGFSKELQQAKLSKEHKFIWNIWHTSLNHLVIRNMIFATVRNRYYKHATPHIRSSTFTKLRNTRNK